MGEILVTARRVLVIAYVFPPTGGAGVQRPAKFVKYLKDYGYEPIVITVKNPSVPIRDETVSSDVVKAVTVLTAKTLEPSYEVKKTILKKNSRERIFETFMRSILIPDPQVLWLPGLMKRVLSLRKNPPDLIFVTAPPFSTLVAGVLTKFVLNRPLVSDFRDEWVGWLGGSSWTSLGRNKRIRSKLEEFLERFVIGHSDAVVSASPGYVEAFKEKYPYIPSERFSSITNGYDPEDFESQMNKEDYCGVFEEDKLNILYMGTVFPLTSLKYFLKGIDEMDEKGNINLIVVGRITAEEEFVLDHFTNCIIKKLGYMPHKEAIQLAHHADALLLTLSPLRGAEKVIPAKIFEYMALRKNIIAILPEGSASDVIKGFSGCVTVHPLDKGLIANTCKALYGKWQSNTLEIGSNEISIHSRKKKTEALCSLFNNILDRKLIGSIIK